MQAERKIIKLTDYLYSIEEDFVRWFLIIGDDKAAVIDTGIFGAGVRQTAESLTDKELILINTHSDIDHISGNGDFDSFYITESDYSESDMAVKFSKSSPLFLSDGQIIELGNRTLEIIFLSGHTSGSVGIYDRTSRSLIAGDTVQDGTIFMFGPGRNPEAFEKSLGKLKERQSDFDRIYASHGTVKLTPDYASKVLDDWNKVRNGDCSYEGKEIFGQKIKYYRGADCGFYVL